MRWPLSLLLPLLLQGSLPCEETCTCAFLTPEQRVAHADAVFVGEVISVRESAPTGTRTRGHFPPRWALVRPVFGWKGVPTDLVELPAGDGPDCLVDFRPGQRYLVFAGGSGRELGTTWCRGTVSMTSQSALDALHVLGTPPPDPSTTPP
jgi:hypothetical protein